MSSVDRFKYFLKVAAYSVPDNDMYAAGSVQQHVNDMINDSTSAKNMGTLAGGALGATAAYKLSKPFADKTIPLKNQKFRNLAMVGAGIYAAKKARNFFSKSGGDQENTSKAAI